MARGSLRIYLGAAPGVGKTYKMLGEGVRRKRARHRCRRSGSSRPTGAAQTAEQIARSRGDAPPRGRVPRHGARRDGRRRHPARRPEVVLVDEYAHTNAPGSRNEKRWQDVEQLLDAGHRRHLHAQHPAPRVAQRRHHPDHRDHPTRDRARRHRAPRRPDSSSSTWPRRRSAAGWPTATSTPPNASTPRSPTTSGPATSARCASWRCCGSPTASRSRCTSYLDAHGIADAWETRERVVVGHHRRRRRRGADPPRGAHGGPRRRRPHRRARRRRRRARRTDRAPTLDGAAQARARARRHGPRRRRPRRRPRRWSRSPGARRPPSSCSVPAGAAAGTSSCTARSSPRVDPARARTSTSTSSPASTTRAARRLCRTAPRPPVERRQPTWRLGADRRRAAVVDRCIAASLRDDVDLSTDLLVFLALVLAIAALGGRLVGVVAAVVASLLVNWFFVPPYPHAHDRRSREPHRAGRVRRRGGRGRRARRHRHAAALEARQRPRSRPRRSPAPPTSLAADPDRCQGWSNRSAPRSTSTAFVCATRSDATAPVVAAGRQL